MISIGRMGAGVKHRMNITSAKSETLALWLALVRCLGGE